MHARRFRLYPVEAGWWSFADYAAVIDAMEWFRPSTVLEFGPGSSTLALLEGGANRIDSCEDDPDWSKVYVERLQEKMHGRVTIRDYTWADPVKIPETDGRRFDFALIDGPKGLERRPAVLAYALAHCDVVMMPTEDCKADGVLRPIIRGLVSATPGRSLTFIETGPLSGGFAIIE